MTTREMIAFLIQQKEDNLRKIIRQSMAQTAELRAENRKLKEELNACRDKEVRRELGFPPRRLHP